MTKKKPTKNELHRRAIEQEIRKMRDELDVMSAMTTQAYETLIDIAYLLAPVIYDVRAHGKYPAKRVRRVDDLIKKNKRSDMTKLERAFWTGEEVE